MSSRHTRSLFGVMLAVVFAFSAISAGPASAKLTKSQKVHIRHQLRKQIKKHPRLIRNKHWIKRASLVNFKLPITVRLRNSDKSTNPNLANIDLGASLGQRSIGLGGELAGYVVFHDSFDGGALGNVDLVLTPSTKHQLTTTSIPLLWNQQVSDPASHWGASLVGAGTEGCGDFKNTGTANQYTSLPLNHPVLGTLPGYPTTNPASLAPLGLTGHFARVIPGIDDIGNLKQSAAVGNDDNLGPQTDPFPTTPSGTYNPDNSTSGHNNFTQYPSVKDTVLRTNALQLNILPAGTTIPQTSAAGGGVEGSQNEVAGQSGGQANLFGDIPGKGYGVDVTVNLGTKIWSLVRSVSSDAGNGLVEGQPWPAGLFNCRQAVTGYVQNYLPGIRLQGNLHISPALTPDGKLRIAKAKLSSPTLGSVGSQTHVALAACLSLYSALVSQQNSTDTTPTTVPSTGYTDSFASPTGPTATAMFFGTTSFLGFSALGIPDGTPGFNLGFNFLPNAQLPATEQARRDSGNTSSAVPNFGPTGLGGIGGCNTTPTQLTQSTQFTGIPAVTDGSLLPSPDGSKVSVAGDLSVSNVDADILIGDV